VSFCRFCINVLGFFIYLIKMFNLILFFLFTKVIHLTSNCKDAIPVFLQSDDEFHRVEALFKSCNVLLRKENDTLTSEITCGEGFLPIVLCIAIHGLASLSNA